MNLASPGCLSSKMTAHYVGIVADGRELGYSRKFDQSLSLR